MNILMKMAAGMATTALAGGLVYGGIYRTQMKNAQELQRELGGNGVRESLSVQQSLGGGGQGSAGSESEGGRGQNAGREDDRIQGSGLGQGADAAAAGAGRGSGSATGTAGQQLDQNQADVHPEEIVLIPTIVQSISSEIALFQTDDGGTIVLEGRALSFAIELGLSLTEGDQVLLEGFFESGDFEVSSLENLTTGQRIVLREPEGRPLWAGGSGRRGGL
ncbi:MAG: hypothetical protein JXA97_12920 [Anaerolineales bacterium]|nr:hypothetical protein [Anaerolineales bacterium]